EERLVAGEGVDRLRLGLGGFLKKWQSIHNSWVLWDPYDLFHIARDPVLLEKRPRRPDADHVHLAEPLLRLRRREPDFRGDERDRVIRPHGRAERLAGVAV